jgi:hypothetical protein
LDLALALVVAIAVAAAALIQQGSSASGTVTPGSPRPVANAFSRAYLDYLDGSGGLAALPDTTSRVRALGAERIPPAARSGPLRLTDLRLSYVGGSTRAQALVVGRDERHGYSFEIDISFLGGRWQVTYIVPPDLATVLAPPARPPASPRALVAAAGRFAVAYVDYREGSGSALPASLPLMRSQIDTGRDPLAATTPTHARGRLVSLTLGPIVRGDVAAHAVVASAASRLIVEFDLKRTSGGWAAWGFPEASP